MIHLSLADVLCCLRLPACSCRCSPCLAILDRPKGLPKGPRLCSENAFLSADINILGFSRAFNIADVTIELDENQAQDTVLLVWIFSREIPRTFQADSVIWFEPSAACMISFELSFKMSPTLTRWDELSFSPSQPKP